MAGKVVVRVYFIDNCIKAIGIDQNTTAANLREMVVERIGLVEDACFALFEKKDDWERCLEPEEKPAEIQLAWEKDKTDKKRSDSDPSPKFLFKKKIFMKDDEKEMEDPIAKDLIYKQALYCVNTSEYPVAAPDAIRLAGLQCQVVYGDHNPAFHTTGFLQKNITDFVPKSLLGSRKVSEWEQAIFVEHQGLSGKNPEDAKMEYLKIVKSWGYYGSTFFPPCKAIGKTLHNHGSKFIIGVNYEGIRLLKPKTKQIISEHFFTEILSWASSSGTFAFEFGNPNHSEKYTFETKHGVIIASTIQTYIDILVQMLRNGEDEEEDTSETGTTNSDPY